MKTFYYANYRTSNGMRMCKPITGTDKKKLLRTIIVIAKGITPAGAKLNIGSTYFEVWHNADGGYSLPVHETDYKGATNEKRAIFIEKY